MHLRNVSALWDTMTGPEKQRYSERTRRVVDVSQGAGLRLSLVWKQLYPVRITLYPISSAQVDRNSNGQHVKT